MIEFMDIQIGIWETKIKINYLVYELFIIAGIVSIRITR